MVFPAAITDTVVLAIPFFDVTEEIALIGIISVSLFRNPVNNADVPKVNAPAASFPPDRPARDHSNRSGNTCTFAFFPATCDVNSNSAPSPTTTSPLRQTEKMP